MAIHPAWLACSEHTTGTPCRLFPFHSCFSPSNFCSSHGYLSSPGLFYCLVFKDISSWQPCGNYLTEQPSQQWHFRRKFVSFLLVNSDFWSRAWSTFVLYTIEILMWELRLALLRCSVAATQTCRKSRLLPWHYLETFTGTASWAVPSGWWRCSL